MKVKLQDGYRGKYTLEDLDRAKMVIAQEKEYDSETPAGWLATAVREALEGTSDCLVEVLQATAHTARNYRAWDAYENGTGDMDIWIEGLARTVEGFIECGAYLTDIWNAGGEPFKHHMFIKRYRPV